MLSMNIPDLNYPKFIVSVIYRLLPPHCPTVSKKDHVNLKIVEFFVFSLNRYNGMVS